MQATLKDSQAFRYQELDSLRGIAALMVVLFHFTMGKAEDELGFKWGTTGVDLFFIISGFVISMSINKVSSGIEFIINRVSRLYPTYWASVTFTFILISAYGLIKGESVRWIDYFGNMTMLQYYLQIPNLDGPYWTMIIEMLFYIFILFLFRFSLLHHILWIGAILCIAIFTLSFFFWNDFTQSLFRAIPLLEFFSLFFAGIIFYKVTTEKSSVVHYLLIGMCLLIQVSLFYHVGKSKTVISQLEYAIMLFIYFSLFTLFANGRLGILVQRPFLFLGKISFALYLTHQYIILGHVLPLLINRLGLNFWISSIFICLPIALLIATLITYFVEIPYSFRMKQMLKMTAKVK